MSRKTQHVIPNPAGGWSVKKGGAKKATKTFITKKDAEAFGRQLAKKQKVELIIHKKDGQIQNSNSFGNDPHPPRDKKK